MTRHAFPISLTGISVRLIATIIVVIMIVEVVIYLPSVSNFRANWLEDKLSVGVRRGAGARRGARRHEPARSADRPAAHRRRRRCHRLSP